MQIQQGIQAAPCIDREPVSDGIAVGTQQPGSVPACMCLPVGQQMEHLEPWYLAASALTLQVALEGCPIFADD